MGMIRKTNPVGLDNQIDLLQQYLFRELTRLWPTAPVTLFPRCDRRLGDKGYEAMLFDGKDYRDVYYDDKARGFLAFFGYTSPTIQDKTRMVARVHLIAFCSTDVLFPDIPHRADEEVRTAVYNVMGMSAFGFRCESVELGLDNVLREYPASIDKLKSVDQGKNYCFRLNLTVHYNPNSSSQLKL